MKGLDLNRSNGDIITDPNILIKDEVISYIKCFTTLGYIRAIITLIEDVIFEDERIEYEKIYIDKFSTLDEIKDKICEDIYMISESRSLNLILTMSRCFLEYENNKERGFLVH